MTNDDRETSATTHRPEWLADTSLNGVYDARSSGIVNRVRAACASHHDVPSLARAIVEALTADGRYAGVALYLPRSGEHLLSHSQGAYRFPAQWDASGIGPGEPALPVGWLGLPLHHADETYGVVLIVPGEHPITGADREALTMATVTIGIAMSRLRLVEIIQQRDTEYQLLAERARSVVMTIDAHPPWNVTFVNGRIEALLGVSRADMLGDPAIWLERILPEDRQHLMQTWNDANQGRDRIKTEYRMVAADGRVVPIDAEAVLIRDAAGQPARWQAILVDLTDRQQADATRADLSLSEAARDIAEDARKRLDRMLESISDSFIHLSPDGIITHVNSRAVRMLGSPAEPTIGSALVERLPEPIRAPVRELIHRATQTGQPQQWEGFDAELQTWIDVRAFPGPDGMALFLQDSTDQKLVERALAESETRLRNYIATSPAVVFSDVWDPEQNAWSIRYLSPRITGLTGFTPEEFITQEVHWSDRVHPDDRAHHLQGLVPLHTPGERAIIEYRFRTRDDRWIWIHDESIAVEEDGQIVAQGVLLDITAQRDAEDARRESEDRLRSLTETIPAAVFIGAWLPETDRWTVEYFSPQIADLTGYTVQEIQETPGLWTSRIHPDDRAAFTTSLAVSRRVGDRNRLIYRFQTKQGDWRCFHDGSAVSREGDRIIVQGIILDISAQRGAEDALRESETRYRSLVEQLPAVVTYLKESNGDEAPRTLYVSPQVEELTGVSAQQWGDRFTLADLEHPDDRDRITQAIARTRSHRTGFDEEYRIVRPDGDVRWVRNILHHVGSTTPDNQPVDRWHGVLLDITPQRMAETALRESELHYRALVEQLPEIVTYVREEDPETGQLRTTYVSPQVYDLTGVGELAWRRPEFDNSDIMHPDDLERVAVAAESVRANASDFDHEYRIVRPDGQLRWIHNIVRYLPHGDGTGEPRKRWHGVMIDITAQREAEERIWSQDARFRAMIQHGSEIITILDADGRIISESPAITSVLGYDLEELVGRSAFELIHEDDRESIVREFSASAAHPGAHGVVSTLRFRHKNGSWRWMEVTGSNFLDHPEIGGMIINSRDITDRKLAEDAFANEYSLLQAVLENSSAAIAIKDRDGRFVRVNAAGLASFGVSDAAQIIGTRTSDHRSAADAEPIEAMDTRVMTSGEAVHGFMERYSRPNGGESWHLATKVPLRNANGEVVGLVATSQDITQIKRTERELQEATARLQVALRASDMGIWRWDSCTGDVVIELDGAVVTRGCFPSDGGPPTGDFAAMLQEDIERIYAARELSLLDGTPFVVEVRHIVPDLGERWFRLHGHVVDEDGADRYRFAGVIVDVTERKEADQRLRASEERFRALVLHTNDVVGIIRLPNELVYVSPAIEAMLGFTPAELVATRERFIYHPNDKATVDAAFGELTEPGASACVEARVQHKNGAWRWLEITVTNHLHSPGIHGIVLNAHDVTHRKESEAAIRAGAERFRALFQHAPDVVLVLDPDGVVQFASPSIEQALGISSDALVAQGTHLAFHEDDMQHVLEHLDQAIEQPRVGVSFRARITHRTLGVRWWEVTATNLLSDPSVGGLVLNARDVTERHVAERARDTSEQRFRSLVQHASDLTAIIDEQGVFTYITPSVERILGYQPDELDRIGELGWLRVEHRARLRAYLDERRRVPGPGEPLELACHHLDGTPKQLEIVATSLLDDPSVRGVVLNARDVTERRNLEQQLKHQAFHDPLTELPNRSLFNDRLAQARARANRTGKSFSVLFLDIDDFKVINDTLGHHAGDQLLRSVANRLTAGARPGDTIARLGGDEFTILLEDLNEPGEAAIVAERLIERFQEPLVVNGHEVMVVPSVGIAIGQPGDEQAQDLLRDADVAMYEAKNRGKAQYVIFDPGMNARAWARLQLQGELRRAIARQQLRVFYQPQVDFTTGQIVEIEALVRWEHPTRGLIPPGEFIPVAEETGMIVPLGRWVLEEACAQACAWNDRRALAGIDPLVLGVNLSARQFLLPSLVDDVSDILSRSGLAPELLRLEITESVALRNLDGTVETMRGLRDLGVKLAIDDFGTGYSGLSYLRYCPIDTIKIDRSYTKGLGTDASDTAMIHAVMAFALTLGLDVCAEGVERSNQVELLRDLGCHRGQGYHYCPALPGDLITAMIASDPAWSLGNWSDDFAQVRASLTAAESQVTAPAGVRTDFLITMTT